MEIISLMMLLLNFSSTQATQAMRTILVQPRNVLKLQCHEKHAERTVWYGQRCNELPFIIIAVIGAANPPPKPIFIQGDSSKFYVKWESNTASFDLTIASFNNSDEGFYYCSVGDGMYTILGSRYTLMLEEKVIRSTQPSVTANATFILHEENGYWQWQRQAVLPVIFLIVSGMALCGIYQIQKQPRRKKQTTHDDEIKQHDGVYTTVYFTSF